MILRNLQIYSLESIIDSSRQNSKMLLDLGGDTRSPFYSIYSKKYSSHLVNLYPDASPDSIVDLESKKDLAALFIDLCKYNYDFIFCFNVLEHLYNPFPCLNFIKDMILSGNANKAIIFVPFLHKYHPSPSDFHRYTIDFWLKFFSDETLNVSVTNHGGSPILMILSILMQCRFSLDHAFLNTFIALSRN